MGFLYLFKAMPLPVIVIMLPLCWAALYGIVVLYNKFFSKLTGRTFVIRKILYKLPFLVILVAEASVAYHVWAGMEVSGSHYFLTGGGWASGAEGAAGEFAVLKTDSFGAISSFLMSLVSLAAGVRALADRRNLFTPRRAAFFLLTCAGIQGMFFSSGLILMFAFMIVTQIGVTGLYGNFSEGEERAGGRHWCYYISRVVLLLMFLAGVVILRVNFGTDNITLLASKLTATRESLLAFIFLTVPLLYIFFKPSLYMPDASKMCFFGLRTQASLFAAFRIIFSLYGPMRELQKVSFLIMMLGFASILLAVMFSSGAKAPERFLDSAMMYMKGLIMIAAGAAMHGTLSAERAALYGVGALEVMVALWLVFLPISAVLAIITVFLKQDSGGREFWQDGRLAERAPVSAVFLFFIILALTGLPPFVGYGAEQLLRAVNFISPFIFVPLFVFTIIVLVTWLRFLVSLILNRDSQKNEFHFAGESTVAFPLILLFMILTVAAAAPGKVFERAVFPSANSLINRIVPFDLTLPSEVHKDV